ncbi:MAG: leucine-rich repeat protein [Oscillospiraceae bacterium]|nr:leucine-rich repeat protein [Oscillospiraceae bacterium]
MKKAISILLLLSLMIGILPITVFAAPDNTFDMPDTFISLVSADEPLFLSTASGIVSYPVAGGELFFDTDTGTITGYAGEITTLVIPEEIEGIAVTSIGSSAFADSYYTLTSVSMPDSILSVGSRAFENCYGLSDVRLSENLTSISERMFQYCYSLRSLYIPDSVTSIETYAFYYSGLASVTIPGSVALIGPDAFNNCKSLVDVTILDGVAEIGNWTFWYCGNLFEITIPESVTSIGNSIFAGCGFFIITAVEGSHAYTYALNNDLPVVTNPPVIYEVPGGALYFNADTGEIIGASGRLTVVEIPSEINGTAVKSIGSRAFADSYYTLTSVSMPDSILSVGNRAFENCYGLSDVKLSENITSISDYAFYCCSSLESIVIPESVTAIGAYAFNYCTSLTKIIIPESVTSIGERAFEDCYYLVHVKLPENITFISDYAFYGCVRLASITIPEGVKSIGSYAFADCYRLTEISMPESVTSIGNSAFRWCESITSVVIPDNVTSIGTYAFAYCDSLTSVVIPGGVRSIGTYAFAYCANLTEVTVLDGVTAVVANLFFNCGNLTEISVPASVTSIASSAFSGCGSFIIRTVKGSYAYQYAINNRIEVATETIVTYEIPGGKLYFDKEIGEISGYIGNLSVVEIPAEIDGVAVVSIGSNAFYNCGGLTEISLPDSLIGIGEWAFYNCRNLTGIIIPEGVAFIGTYAFYYCTGLTSVTIPGSVTLIDSAAFYYCSSLTEVTIREGVETIDSYAFAYCGNLSEISIPASVTSIYSYAFYDCGYFVIRTLKNSYAYQYAINNGIAVITNQIAEYFVPGGKLFFDAETSAITGYSGAITEIEIPAEIDGTAVTSIGERVFYNCNTLTSAVLPDGLKTIGSSAFSGCGSLYSINIPDSVTEIGDSAFSNCRSLTSITVPGGVNVIGSFIFSNCGGLTEAVILDGATKIGDSMFQSCNNLMSVTLPDTLTSIGSSAFYGCRSLKSVILPEGITAIEYSAFSDCGLTSVTIPGSVTAIKFAAFDNCGSLTEVIILDGVSCVIEWVAFGGCKNLSEITIPGSVTSIDSYAFSGCEYFIIRTVKDSYAHRFALYNNITVITEETAVYPVPGGILLFEKDTGKITGHLGEITAADIPAEIDGVAVMSIGERAFYNCASLAEIKIPDGVTSIGDYAFYNCGGLPSVTLPDTLTSIGNYAFSYCKSLTSVIMPASVTSIGSNLFSSCDKLTNATILGDITAIPGAMFYDCSGLTSVILPDVITTIEWNAFYNCSSLTSVNLPDTLASIGDSAFSYCRSLTSVNLPDTLTSIGSGAFSGCVGLTSIILPEGLQSIGDSAFSDCTGLTSLTLPESVTSIESWTFYNCKNLTSITLPNELTYIGTYAFSYCVNLTSLTIPNNVATVEYCAFYNCENLASVTISENVRYIGWWAFSGCDALTIRTVRGSDAHTYAIDNGIPVVLAQTISYEIPGGKFYFDTETGEITGFLGALTIVDIPDAIDGIPVISIGDSAFYNCRTLTQIILPDGLKSIGERAFYNCENLTEINIPAGVSKIGDRTFYNCGKLAIITIPDGLEAIGEYAFYNCDSLTSVDIPEGVIVIENYVFYDCGGLLSVTVPNGVQSIGSSAFSNCGSLISIALPDTLTSIGSSAFYSCGGLTSIIFPEGLQSIGDSAFSWCIGLTWLTIPNSVTAIGSGAFSDCKNLTSITLPNELTEISSYMFSYCVNLISLTISENVKSIGWSAFSGCSALTIRTVRDSYAYSYAINNGIRVVIDQTVSYPIPGGMLYFDPETGKITGCLGELTVVVIPPEIDGIPVTSIGTSAFYNCHTLTKITLPDSIKTIGNGAFSGCGNLSSINIPDSVTEIGDGAFSSCYGLTSITLPDGLKSIGNSTFSYCRGLKGITIPGSVLNIGDYAFQSCYGLTEVTIPYNVTSIGDYAFSYSGLDQIVILDNVTSIGYNAFYGCPNLTIVTVEDSHAQGYAFYNGIKVILLDMDSDDEPPVITKITTKGSLRINTPFTMYISATDNNFLSKIELQYSFDSGDTFTTAEVRNINAWQSVTDLSFTIDASVLPDGSMIIRARAFDLAGNASQYEYFLGAITVDHTPPAKPDDFQVNTTPSYIQLTWTKNAVESDFSHFNVYRSSSPNGIFTQLKSINSIGYFDDATAGIEYGEIYYYYVTSVDDLGNESEGTEILSGCLNNDDIPPTIVSFLPKESEPQYHTIPLQVSAHDNFKLNRVILEYRKTGETNWTPMTVLYISNKTGVVSYNWYVLDLPPGNYEVKMTAVDAAGLYSQPVTAQYTIGEYSVPAVPELSAQSGHKSVSLSWTYGGQGNILQGYEVYRKQGSGDYVLVTRTSSNSYAERLPLGDYTYIVVAHDKYGAARESNAVTAASILDDDVPPVAIIAMRNTQYAAGTDIVFDASYSYDNDVIVKYEWDFGDGSNHSYEKTTTRSYSGAGNYTVILRVTDESGNVGSQSMTLNILDVSEDGPYSLVRFTVTDNLTGDPLSGSQIIINAEDMDEVIIFTGADGIASVILEKGKLYEVTTLPNDGKYSMKQDIVDLRSEIPAENKPQYMAADISITAFSSSADNTVDVPIKMRRANMLIGELTAREMTFDEIEKAGINPNDPNNMIVKKFTIDLIYEDVLGPKVLPVTYYQNSYGEFLGGSGSGWGDGWGGGNCWFGLPYVDGYFCIYQPLNDDDDNKNKQYILKISGNFGWMKQIFEVELFLCNTSVEDWIENCSATLDLPNGLSFAGMTSVGQWATQDIEKIEEGEVKYLRWYVRGDNPGEYDLKVDVKGTYYPEPKENFKKTFVTSSPLVVRDIFDAIAVDVSNIPNEVKTGETHMLTFTFSNISDSVLNYVTMSIEGIEKSIDILAPGESVSYQQGVTFNFTSSNKDSIGFRFVGMIKVCNSDIPPTLGFKYDREPPKITPMNLYGVVNKQFDVVLELEGGDYPDYPVTWEVVGDYDLPENLKLDRNQGIISGVPSEKGTYVFSIQAESPAGKSEPVSFILTVYSDTPEITITSQPADTTSYENNNLNVSATVTEGAILSYQWYSNVTASNVGGTAISEATGASFPIPTGLSATPGTYYYFCEVRATGGADPVRSNVATVWAFDYDPNRHLDYWFRSKAITFRFINGDTDWQTRMKLGMTNWNAHSGESVKFSEIASSINTVTVKAIDDTYIGRWRVKIGGKNVPQQFLSSPNLGPRLIRFAIEMNSRALNNKREWITSVFAHELGHAVGLEDNPIGAPGKNGSIMNYKCDMTKITGPTGFDIQSVNMIYGGASGLSAQTSDAANIMYIAAKYPHYDSISDLASYATDVVRGKVLDERVELLNTNLEPSPPGVDDDEDDDEIYTVYRIEVLETFLGNAVAGDILELRQIGGQLGDELVINSDYVSINVGDDLIFFMRESYIEDYPHVYLNSHQSIYIYSDTDGTLDSLNPENDLNLTRKVLEQISRNYTAEGEITIGTNKWNNFFDTITFELFFKNTQTATITAKDDGMTVEYYLSPDMLTLEELEALTEWQIYDGAIGLNPNSKYIIYAKLTGASGNPVYINSSGVVIYTDSEALTENISYIGASGENQTVDVRLNGNTIQKIMCGSYMLEDGKDYAVANETITFESDYLESFAAGEYTLTVYYNPLGMEYADADGNEAPATTAIALTVLPAVIAELKSITVSTLPDKTKYTIGETLDLSSMIVTASYSDGAEKAVTDYETTPTQGDILAEAGKQTVIVSYAEDGINVTAGFEIIITEPGHEHDYTAEITKPNCTEQGYTTYTCDCGDEYVDNYVSALGHDFSVLIDNDNKDATCEKEGYDVYKCSRCDETDKVIIPALGHNWNTGIITGPTCTEQGYTTYTCSVCKENKIRKYVAALGHDWDGGTVTKEPTEYENGIMTYACSRCDEKREESISATGHKHDYTAVISNPTCTEQGYTTYTCSCGDYYIDHYTIALGHDFSVLIDHKDATCEENGCDVFRCNRCDETDTVVISALDHDWIAVITIPTCTEQGYTTYTCSICNEPKVGEYASALGHDFSVLIDHKDATATENGYDIYKCVRCAETKTIIIPKTGEAVIIDVSIAENGFISIVETSKKSNIWVLTFKAAVTYSDDKTEIGVYSIRLIGNNSNLDGEYTFADSHELAGYMLTYDIKGNGANIKTLNIKKIN